MESDPEFEFSFLSFYLGIILNSIKVVKYIVSVLTWTSVLYLYLLLDHTSLYKQETTQRYDLVTPVSPRLGRASCFFVSMTWVVSGHAGQFLCRLPLH